jgi:methylenetetrahydrofolate--tRNA-(uracil-5-)-methyltransferase
MPPLPERFRKADRKKAYTDRARAALAGWLVQAQVREPA